MGPHDMKINKELRQSVGKPKQRYQGYLEEKRNRKRKQKKI